MAGKGWVKVHRELLDKAIFHNEKMLKVFLWCILKATHEDYKQLVGRQLVDLIPGQFVTGRFKAGEELRLKPSTVWEYLKVLESNNTINIKSNNKYSVITVVNWGSYQSSEVNSDIKTDIQPDNKSTTNQHKQEHKNIKNKEDSISKDDFGEFSNVKLSEIEHKKLIDKYGDKASNDFIEKLDNYIESTGKKYKSHYATILNWLRNEPGIKKTDYKKPTMTIDA